MEEQHEVNTSAQNFKSDTPESARFKSPLLIGAIILLVVFVGASYYYLATKRDTSYQETSTEQPAQETPAASEMSQEEGEALPTLTQTDTTSDIEKDINGITITAEDEGFVEVNTDLNSL